MGGTTDGALRVQSRPHTTNAEIGNPRDELRALREHVAKLERSNKDLGSRNARLRSSIEELNSTVERLTTVDEGIAGELVAAPESKSFISSILDNVGHAVIVTDCKFNVLRANSAAARLLGISEADIGQSINGLRPRIPVPDLRRLLNRAADDRKTSSRQVRADSTWYRLQVRPLADDQGALLGIMVAFKNVTSAVEAGSRLRASERELAQLSERQSAILDSLPVPISLIDLDGNIIAVNREWIRFAEENGCGHASCELGANYIEICGSTRGDGAETGALVGACLRALLQGRLTQSEAGQDRFEVRYSQHTRTERRWFRCIARPVVSGETRFGALIMHVDETEQVIAEHAIRAANDLAQEANEAKTRFLANMSHELRTPLNAILGFSEMQKSELYGGLGHPKYLEYASDIHSEGRRLLEMISQILDLSKVEDDKLEVNETTVDVRACQKAIFKEVQETARAKGIDLSARFARGLPKLYADKGQVWQMVTNVMTNALKFTGKKGRIAFSASIDREGWMVISLADDGVGVAKSNIARIIEPFSQVRSTLTSNNSGVGLGLALVNSLIKLHQGELDIDSTVGKGTTVTLRFPPERVIQRRLAKSA